MSNTIPSSIPEAEKNYTGKTLVRTRLDPYSMAWHPKEMAQEQQKESLQWRFHILNCRTHAEKIFSEVEWDLPPDQGIMVRKDHEKFTLELEVPDSAVEQVQDILRRRIALNGLPIFPSIAVLRTRQSSGSQPDAHNRPETEYPLDAMLRRLRRRTESHDRALAMK